MDLQTCSLLTRFQDQSLGFARFSSWGIGSALPERQHANGECSRTGDDDVFVLKKNVSLDDLGILLFQERQTTATETRRVIDVADGMYGQPRG